MTGREEIEGSTEGQVSKILRNHFGRGPRAMHVQWAPPFITLYLQEFLAPIERTLRIKQGPRGIEQLRYAMMQELLTPIRLVLETETISSLKEMYYDWNLQADGPSNGMIWGVLDNGEEAENMRPWSGDLSKERVEEQIARLSKHLDKVPEEVYVSWVGRNELVIEQVGILLGVEQALITNGHEKVLKRTKTALEKKVFVPSSLEPVVKRTIQDVFLDWDFQRNKAYMIIRFQKREKNH